MIHGSITDGFPHQATVQGVLRFSDRLGGTTSKTIPFSVTIADASSRAEALFTSRYAASAIAARYTGDGEPCWVEIDPSVP